jgi:hypothetical protein
MHASRKDITLVLNPTGKDSNGSITNFFNGGIYLIKLGNGQPVQFLQPAYASTTMITYKYLCEPIVLQMNNQYVLIYQEGYSKYDLKKVVLDQDFKPLSNETIAIYKEHDFYLATDEYLRLDTNKYLIWGRYKDKVGSVVLE